jgi:hypothetical protein
MTPIDKGAIDTVCIYCPETDECYYVRPEAHGASVTLRITPVEMANRQECWMLPHFASCRAQFTADLSGSAAVNDALSGAWGGPTPSRPPNLGMKGGAPLSRNPAPATAI